MSNLKLLYKLLRLKELKITWFEFRNRDTELHFGVKPYKNGCRCAECGRRGRVVRTAEARTWTDVTVLGLKIIFHYAPKEIECPTHGRGQEEIPWAAPLARVTYRLEWRICALSQIMTQKAAAEILKMPPSTLSDLLHRVIKRTRDGHKIRGLVTLGVDEISYLKGRKFCTIVYDLDRSRILWVGKGKGRETIDKFFNEQLSEFQRKQITWASCDMSKAYTEAIKHHCPNVKLVIDRFHIVKALNEAVDEVRKEEWRLLDVDGRKAVKGLRWLLGMNLFELTREIKSPYPPGMGAQGRVQSLLGLPLRRLSKRVSEALDDFRPQEPNSFTHQVCGDPARASGQHHDLHRASAHQRGRRRHQSYSENR
jgi:transposase